MSLTKQDKQDIQEIVDVTVNRVVNKAVDDLSEVIANFATQVNGRFNKVEADIHFIKNDIAELRQDVVDIKHSIDRLTNTIDAFVKRLDDIETENSARDAQFERLLEWAREVSAKTGIPLRNL